MTAFDQGQDRSGRELLRIAQQYAAPEFVKEASSEAIYGADLPPRLYADPLHQAYPLHTPAATWTSYAFYCDTEKRAADDPVRARLDKAARYWGIESECKELRSRAAARRQDLEAQLSDDDYALVEKFADGEVARHVRLADARDVKQAAAWFVRNLDTFTFADRQQVAARILNKAAAFGVTLDEAETFQSRDTNPLGGVQYTLQKCAGIGSSPVTDAVDLLYDRAGRIARRHEPAAELLVKTAAAIEADPARLVDHQQRLKLAAVIDEVDRATGLDWEYAEGLLRPEDVLFAVTPKTAQAFVSRHVAVPGGAIYRAEELEQLPLGELADRLGTDFAKAASADGVFVDAERLGAALATAARADRDRFAMAAADLGVVPAAVDRPLQKLDKVALARIAASA